jgi:hypothetical protein
VFFLYLFLQTTETPDFSNPNEKVTLLYYFIHDFHSLY